MSNTGWICPRCQKVHAPSVQSCNCLPGHQSLPPNPIPLAIPGIRPGFVPPDCGCDPNKICGSSACPRATRITLGPNTAGAP